MLFRNFFFTPIFLALLIVFFPLVSFASKENKRIYPLEDWTLSTNNMKVMFDHLTKTQNEHQDNPMSLLSYSAQISEGKKFVLTLYRYNSQNKERNNNKTQNDHLYLVYGFLNAQGQLAIQSSVLLNNLLEINIRLEYAFSPYLLALSKDDMGIFLIQSNSVSSAGAALTKKTATLLKLGKTITDLGSVPFGCLYRNNSCSKEDNPDGLPCSLFNYYESSVQEANSKNKNVLTKIDYQGSLSKKINGKEETKVFSSERELIWDKKDGKYKLNKPLDTEFCPAELNN